MNFDSDSDNDDAILGMWDSADTADRRILLAAKASICLAGAREMEPGSTKNLLVPALENMLGRLTSPQCHHCNAPEPRHYYACPLAQKCRLCKQRTDLPDEPHPNPCPLRKEIQQRRRQEIRERRERLERLEREDRRRALGTSFTLEDFIQPKASKKQSRKKRSKVSKVKR